MKTMLWALVVAGMVMLGVVLALAMDVQAATQNAVLTWTDVTGEDGYIVERAIGTTGTWGQIGSKLAAGVVTFTDVNITQGTNFCYRVTATSALGNGPASDPGCVTSAGVPGKVGGLSITIQIVP